MFDATDATSTGAWSATQLYCKMSRKKARAWPSHLLLIDKTLGGQGGGGAARR